MHCVTGVLGVDLALKYVSILLLAHDRGLFCTASLYCSVCYFFFFASVKVRRSTLSVKVLKLN